MKFSLRKNLKLAFLVALPLILFAMLRDKASWRPQRINFQPYSNAAAISADDRLLADKKCCGVEFKVDLYDLLNGEVVKNWAIGHDVARMSFSSDGKILAMAWAERAFDGSETPLGVTLRDENGTLRELAPVITNLDSDYLEQLRFSPDGKTLWLASTKNLRAWDLSSGKLQWQWRSGNLERYAQANSVAISKDCRFYFRHDDDGYLVWDIAQKKPALYRKVPVFYGNSLNFSPDASLAVYPDHRGTYSNVIIDTRSGRELWRTSKEASEFEFAGDKIVFVDENKFKVCDARTGKFLYELPARPQSLVNSTSSKDWLYSVDVNSGDYFRQRFR